MNKLEKKLLMIISLLLVISCGGGGDSSKPTPTDPNVEFMKQPDKNPNFTNNIQYSDTDYTESTNGRIPGSVNDTSYTRFVPTVNVLMNKKFGTNGKIYWNDSERTYSSSNPDNSPFPTLYVGKDVKVGIIDNGFNTERYWKDLTSNIYNIERIPTDRNRYESKHGTVIAKMMAGEYGHIRLAQLYVIDVSSNKNDEAKKAEVEEKHFRALYDKGVRIFNNSYGLEVIENDPEKVFNPGIYDFVKMAVENGSLFVWAGGNEENLNYGTSAGNLPRLNASLEKGWINVVGLTSKDSTENFEWGNLKPYSPAGSSKNWTVSAIGKVSETVAGESANYFGSSFAAPRVTAAAAMLKQKYPFMTGDLLRQTILSTATDIGDRGVDDIYGWGLLDVQKALKGPALFDKRLALGDKVNIVLDGGSYSFENDISGDAGLNLTGTGTLTLNGKMSYTGDTIIGSGAYLKVRKISGTKLLVNESAKLEIENANVSEITSSGKVINTGNAHIANLKLHNGSEFVTDVNGTVVTENAQLDGKITVTNNKEEYFSKKGRTASLITGNVSGNAQVETSSELLEAKTDTNSEGVQATVSRKDVSEYAKDSGADEQQKNTAKQIETTLGEVDTLADSGIAASETLSKAAQLQSLNFNTLDSMSGQIYASAQSLTFEQSETVNRDLSNRMSDLARSLENDKKFGLWTSGIFSKGNIEKAGFAKGKTTVKGGQIGFDMKVTDSAIAGVAIDYSKGKVKFDRYNGESKADMTGFSLYGRQNFGNIYVAGRLGFGYSDTEVKRDIIVNKKIAEYSKITHKDNSLSTYFEGGYDVKLNGDLAFTPYVALGSDKVTRGKFSESNTDFGMTADKKSYNMPYATIGTKAVKRFGNTDLTGYIGYTKGLNKKDLNFEAAYNFAPVAKFEVKGINYSRDKVNAGIGVRTEIKEGLSWYSNYDYKHSTDKSKADNHMVTTGVRIEF